MKIEYKNKTLERYIIALNALGITMVATTFVMLFGFDTPPLPAKLLHIAEAVMFFFFLTEKIIRFFNAVSKREYLSLNWFELPLLVVMIFVAIGAGRWFAFDNPLGTLLDAVSIYLVVQVIDKLCRSVVNLAAAGHNPARSLVSLFVVLIFAGAGLLMLPKAHNLPSMSFTDAVFTATSATCVTGLIVKDTGKDFSILGQIVILSLIQLGGLGIVVFGAVLGLLLGQSLSVRESAAMQDLLSTQTLSRIGRIVAFIFIATILIESLGAVSLYRMWSNVPQTPTDSSWLWFCSVFHSISAFCNAGFSLFSKNMIDYNRSAGVYTIIAPLIFLGGLGFGVLLNLSDVASDRIKRRFWSLRNPSAVFQLEAPKRILLQTKVVLTVSVALILAGAVLIKLFETFRAGPNPDHTWAVAFFQSVTARTAGFNTVDIASMSASSKLTLIFMMFIGGSPGSTAGGIKTVTFAVVLMVAWATLRKRRDVEMFNRSIRLVVLGRAITVILLFLFVLLAAASCLTITERNNPFTLMDIYFESASALGTVGLTTGITASLTTAGKWIIILTMLIGRLGPLTLLTSLMFTVRPAKFDYPSEPLVVG